MKYKRDINLKYIRTKIIAGTVLLWLSILACGANNNIAKPIDQVSESDVIGIWEGHYSLHNEVEFLIIKGDGTYQQIVHDSTGYLYTSDVANWFLEPQGAGRLFIRFEKGRYFAAGPKFADLLGKDELGLNQLYPFYDPVDSGAIYMDNEFIVEIVPSNNVKGIRFVQFLTDIHAEDNYLYPVEP